MFGGGGMLFLGPAPLPLSFFCFLFLPGFLNGMAEHRRLEGTGTGFCMEDSLPFSFPFSFSFFFLISGFDAISRASRTYLYVSDGTTLTLHYTAWHGIA